MYETRGYPIDAELRSAHRTARRPSRPLAVLRTLAAAALRSGRPALRRRARTRPKKVLSDVTYPSPSRCS